MVDIGILAGFLMPLTASASDFLITVPPLVSTDEAFFLVIFDSSLTPPAVTRIISLMTLAIKVRMDLAPKISKRATSTAMALKNHFRNSTATMESSPYAESGFPGCIVEGGIAKTLAAFSMKASIRILILS